MKQTTLRTNNIEITKNISLPIGSIKAVEKYFEKLDFSSIFSKFKTKGRSLFSLIEGLVSYKLTENFSISKASDWINKPEILSVLSLDEFEERTLFRVLETIGINREEIILDIQKLIFKTYKFKHTDVVLDWTSLILWGIKSSLGKYGYSRDHRPDKKQITIGLAALASPINIPVGMTIKKGNEPDVNHFTDTYNQVKKFLEKGSLVTFDKGPNSKENLELVSGDKLKYLTLKKLNKSDDKRIKAFDKSKATLIDSENLVYGIKYETPKKFDYFFFSETLKTNQIEAKKRNANKKYEEAKEIQNCIDTKKDLPKKYKINNELINVTYSYQTKLKELGEEGAKKFIENASINGREGFFCIISSKNLTLEEALATYRKKDIIEKIINSMKNEIEIKPLRVWSDNSIYGALIIGFIAQLIVSLIRYDNEELKQTSTKFIRNSLMNLTVTIEYLETGSKRQIFSNFDPINELILIKNQGIT